MDVTVGFFNWALGHATVNIAAVGWMKDILLDSNSKRPHDEGGSRKPLDPARLQLRRKCGDLWRSRLLGSFASVRDSTLSPEAVRLFALRRSELWTATASLIYVLAKAGEWTGLLPAPVPAQGEKTTEQLYIDQRIHLLDSATEYILSEDGSSVSQSSSDPDGEKELLSLEVCRMMLTKAKAAVDFEAFGTMDRDAGSGSSTNAAEVPR